MEINIPTSHTVTIASTGRDWTVDLTKITADVVIHMIQHALKQKLGDAAAGAAAAVRAGDYADVQTAAIEMVTKRMATVLNVPTPGEARATMTVLEKAIVAIVRDMQAGKKVKGPDRATTPAAGEEWVRSVAGDKFDAIWERVLAGADAMVAAKPSIEI